MNTQTEGRTAGPSGFLYHSAARALSFLLALALSTLIFVYPKAIASSINDVNHGMLSLLMWGIAAGFVHGVGYDPIHRLWRIVFGPLLGWGLMLFGIVFVLWQGA